MSRKKQDLRPFAGVTTLHHVAAFERTSNDASPSADPNARQTFTPESTSPRVARLAAYSSEINANNIHHLRPAVVDLVNRVPYSSDDVDDSLCCWAYDFADWVLTVEGAFDPTVHMTEDRFSAFLRDRKKALSSASRSTGRSALRRLKKGLNGTTATRANKENRMPVQSPYSEGHRHRHYGAARTLTTSDHAECLSLLDLTYGAGLASPEVARAEGSWIRERNGRQVTVMVPNPDGVVREVPVFGEAAGRLLSLRDSGYLIRPNLTSRRNAVSDLVAEVAKSKDDFKGFRVARARARWITDYMFLPVPFVVVCRLAGISAKARTFPDLLDMIPPGQEPTPAELINAVKVAREQMGLGA